MAENSTRHTNQSSKSSASRRRSVSGRRPSQGQRTSNRSSNSRASSRKANSASHANVSYGRPSRTTNQSATRSAGSSGSKSRRSSRSNSAKLQAEQPRAQKRAQTGAVSALSSRLLSNRIAVVVVSIIALLLVVVLCDTVGNMGKAYGNVSINGMDVSGMTADEMQKALEESFGANLAYSKVTIYASEEARARESEKYAKEEDAATVEQISADEAKSKVTSWTADGSALHATLPYEQVIATALEAGRTGGPFGRIALAIGGEDVPLTVAFDADALESLATEIDETVGDARLDATVTIDDGVASAVDGRDGNMVDRAWLSNQISNVMLDKNGESYVIAESSYAPSRTSYEQAQSLAEAINKALTSGLSFTYKTASWTADAVELGNWTRVSVIERNGGYDLGANIDPDVATAALVKHVSGNSNPSSSEEVTVDFELVNGEIVVKTSGAGEIPEVVPAIEMANAALYGEGGAAWNASVSQTPVIEIQESSAPETLTFDQAVDLGIITSIGEYTTEYANDEGTENRNHNIHLVSDILNDTICDANGGRWSFNTNTGDTNLDPPFSSAGSIVNGEYVDSIGGGICQVATTVFNAVYEAGLDIVERRNHSLYIASYPTGRDVGVSYPELDFVWENKLPSDVLLKLSYTDTTITAKLFSVYTGYKVESKDGEWEEGEKYRTEFEVDDTMEKGDYYMKTVGEDGSKISVYRTVKDKSGAVVSETEFSSVYEPKNEVYLIGPGTDTSKLEAASEARVNGEEYDEQDEEDLGDDDYDSNTEDEDYEMESSQDDEEYA